MRKRLVSTVAMALCTQLSGCFVVYVPASLVNKAADGITGDSGEHCVQSNAKVGDLVSGANNTVWRVVSLSPGSSMRCPAAAQPVRAVLELVPGVRPAP